MNIDKPTVDVAAATRPETEADPASDGENLSKIPDTTAQSQDVVQMNDGIERPTCLRGTTYKLSFPDHVSNHALYITINDMVLNEATAHETRVPFELFISTKNLEHYQWIVALTLILSAVFRKGGDLTFLVEQLETVFDPRGGYWDKGRYVNSIPSQIGSVIKSHLISIGLMESVDVDEHQT